MTRFSYRAEAHTAAAAHGLDPDVVVAVCLHESYDYGLQLRGVAHAFRHEPGFWLRYMVGDPRWRHAVPMRVSSSYGLMQVMYTTALAHGFPADDPPEFLFVPTVNLEYGCRELKKCLDWGKGDLDTALAGYNGGRSKDNGPTVPTAKKRNAAYVAKVRHWIDVVKKGGVIG